MSEKREAMMKLREEHRARSWLTFDEMNDLLKRAEAAGDGNITLPARELARVMKSHIIADQGYREVRAAARREIIRIQNSRSA